MDCFIFLYNDLGAGSTITVLVRSVKVEGAQSEGSFSEKVAGGMRFFADKCVKKISFLFVFLSVF